MTPNSIPVWARTASGEAAHERFASHPPGRDLDFCIIGAAKCGTTSLAAWLGEHPDVHVVPRKEPQFFSTDAMYARGIDWYRGIFQGAAPQQKCGEGSVTYSRYPASQSPAERLARHYPDVRLIYVVREPVARLESDCLQSVKFILNTLGDDHTALPLDRVLETFDDPCSPYYTALRESGNYCRQLGHYDALFPAEQILVVLSEDLRQDEPATMGRVHEFLGLASFERTEPATVRNETSAFIEKVSRRRAADRLARLPGYDLARRVLPQSMKDRAIRVLSHAPDPATTRFSDGLRQELRRYYAPQNDLLRKRLGRKLTGWS